MNIWIQGLNSEAHFPPYHPTEKSIPNKSATFELYVHSINTPEDMLCKTLPSSVTSLTEFFLHGVSQVFFIPCQAHALLAACILGLCAL